MSFSDNQDLDTIYLKEEPSECDDVSLFGCIYIVVHVYPATIKFEIYWQFFLLPLNLKFTEKFSSYH